MALELELKLTAECEDCGAKVEEKHYGNWFGIQTEENDLIQDMLLKLEFDSGWETVRESYEELKLYCPRCKAQRAAA
jgi:Zn finger protein HypA/HybF involved in hydrogenase expression